MSYMRNAKNISIVQPRMRVSVIDSIICSLFSCDIPKFFTVEVSNGQSVVCGGASHNNGSLGYGSRTINILQFDIFEYSNGSLIDISHDGPANYVVAGPYVRSYYKNDSGGLYYVDRGSELILRELFKFLYFSEWNVKRNRQLTHNGNSVFYVDSASCEVLTDPPEEFGKTGQTVSFSVKPIDPLYHQILVESRSRRLNTP